MNQYQPGVAVGEKISRVVENSDLITHPQRLYSLDALRGFDMFWIMGAEEIFHTLYRATGSPFWGTIANQFTHPAWNGFHFYDLIFPLFLFIAGVATPYSVGRELEKGENQKPGIASRGKARINFSVAWNNCQ